MLNVGPSLRMPSFGDLERKRKIIEYAVATRKQIIKVYAITKWAKVADDVQTALVLVPRLSPFGNIDALALECSVISDAVYGKSYSSAAHPRIHSRHLNTCKVR